MPVAIEQAEMEVYNSKCPKQGSTLYYTLQRMS